jgi:MFS family permease
LFTLSTDGWLLFGTRIIRLFAYGFLSVVLVFFLAAAGLTETQIGVLLTLTLIGDTVISLWITTTADRIGRRRMLITGAVLMVFGGTLFTVASNFALLVVAATIGVISPSGNEVGPFLSIEQAALAQIIPPARRTSIFAWYNLVGSFATALGALSVGALSQGLHITGVSALGGYRTIVMSYAAMGSLIAFLFTRLSPAVEATQTDQGSESRLLRKSGAGNPAGSSSSAERALSGIEGRLGLRGSGRVVLKLSALFSLDAFAGGFVLQSIVAYWFYVRFGVQPAVLGGIFFGGNILAGLSALAAARLASRIGLINTMVFTHFPSNILLILVPLMPNLHWAIVVLLARFSISQMDVPTRQSFTMAVVDPDERSAAAGVTSIARSVGSSLAPALAGRLMGASLLNVPFFLAGGLKIVYDLLLYQSFRAIKTSEETTARSARCSMIDSSPKVESPK